MTPRERSIWLRPISRDEAQHLGSRLVALGMGAPAEPDAGSRRTLRRGKHPSPPPGGLTLLEIDQIVARITQMDIVDTERNARWWPMTLARQIAQTVACECGFTSEVIARHWKIERSTVSHSADAVHRAEQAESDWGAVIGRIRREVKAARRRAAAQARKSHAAHPPNSLRPISVP